MAQANWRHQQTMGASAKKKRNLCLTMPTLSYRTNEEPLQLKWQESTRGCQPVYWTTWRDDDHDSL